VTFRTYLRLEGTCAVVLGVVLVGLAALFGRWDGPPWAAPALAVVAGALAVVAARAATRSAVARAQRRSPLMSAGSVRRQTVVETVAWAVAVGAWIAVTGDSAELIAGTGAATVAFGVLRAVSEVPEAVLVDRRRYVLGATVTRPAG
jgi:hypothetical protein